MITNLFLSVLEISLSTSLLILALIMLAPLLNRRYAAKWNYLIWIFLALRLLIPFHGPSLANILAQFKKPVTTQTEHIPTATRPSEAITTQRIIVEIPSQFTTPIVAPSEKSNTGITLLNAVAVIWLAGAFAFVSLHFFSYLHYRRQLLKKGTVIKDAPSLQLLLRLSEELNIKQKVTPIEYSEANSPMMMGFLKPLLVLPKECYGAEELYFILKHELIHLKRRDVYAKLLFVAANAMHWFNPFIWLMQKEAVVDMELSCDERVIRGAEYTIRRAYTETLFSTLHKKRAKKTVLSTQFYGGKQVMKKRFKNILEKAKKKNGALFLICAIVLMIGCGTLIGCSVNSAAFGQENKQEDIETIYHNVLENYQKAKPLIYGAQIQTGEQVTDENGQPYLLVMDFAYQNTASIQKVLDSAFSTTYIKTYLSWVLDGNYPLYKEIDGRLCVALEDAVGEDLTEEITAIVEQKEDMITLRVAGDLDPYEVTLVQENGKWVIDEIKSLLIKDTHVMDGINVPTSVLETAIGLVSDWYETAKQSFTDYNYSNFRISSLSHCYTYENLSDMMLQIYQINYEFLSNTPENVIPAGGMSVTEDGWVTPDYPDSYYLVFLQDGETLSFQTTLFENDCFPGDELFTEDLERMLASIGTFVPSEETDPEVLLAYLNAFDTQNLSFDVVEWVSVPSDRATELGFTEDDGPSGFVIYNAEEQTITLPFATDCSFTLLDWYDSYAPIEVTPEEFLTILAERNNDWIPYWLTVKGNEIIKVQEQYVP